MNGSSWGRGLIEPTLVHSPNQVCPSGCLRLQQPGGGPGHPATAEPIPREVELIHVGRERARLAKASAKAFTVLVDVASPQQANLLIWEEVILGYIHHAVELFHQDCHVTRCYQCQGIGHMVRVCRHKPDCWSSLLCQLQGGPL